MFGLFSPRIRKGDALIAPSLRSALGSDGAAGGVRGGMPRRSACFFGRGRGTSLKRPKIGYICQLSTIICIKACNFTRYLRYWCDSKNPYTKKKKWKKRRNYCIIDHMKMGMDHSPKLEQHLEMPRSLELVHELEDIDDDELIREKLGPMLQSILFVKDEYKTDEENRKKPPFIFRGVRLP